MRSWLAYTLGRYEPETATFLSRHLRSSHVFFDIGAHTGYYTRLALRLMDEDAMVVAFEPDPEPAAVLRATLADDRLVVRDEAVGRDDHAAQVERRPGLCSRIANESIAVDRPAETTTVQVRSLDSMVESGEVPAPDLLKIDVEGGELLALEGMCKILDRKPTAVVECHSMPLLRDVLGQFVDRGYGHVEVTRGGDEIGPPKVCASG